MARWPKLAKTRESRTFSLALETAPKLSELAKAVEMRLGIQCNTGRIIDLLVRDATATDVVHLILTSEVTPTPTPAAEAQP